ncbi:MAG: nitrogen fixation protein NifQ [Campylobacterales bacterium]
MKNNYYTQKIEELLIKESVSSEGKIQAKRVAEKSVLFNHLYEDMGFSSREQMNEFMKKHYEELASKKPKSVRWKKYLYDCIGEVAPACAGCPDEDICFSCKS